MHQYRRRLSPSRARLRSCVQQIKRSRAAVRKRTRSSQRNKRARILRHALPPTLFSLILEYPAQTHRKGIAHGWPPLSDSISTRRRAPAKKQKRLTLSSVSRLLQFWLLTISSCVPPCASI